ncbi:MAG TPA: zinc ribbon domain-containing protein, partial [Chloroflexota bacterium]|nr:zinc ribbon domain-containing protein [Chloroflexota bacterium]
MERLHLMYCSSCGSPNGDFAVRCHNCGLLLPSQARVPTTTRASPSAHVNTILAGTTIAIAVCLIGLAALITQRGLWPQLFSPLPTTAVDAVERSATASLRQRAVPMPTASVIPRPVHPTMLDLGQVGSSDSWRFVVNDVSFAPDESANGWYRAVITYTLLNTSDRAAELPIPSTVPNEASHQQTTTRKPSFIPLPSIPEEDPSVANGLRLYLLDRGGRAFGGGFGTSGGGYEFIAASG